MTPDRPSVHGTAAIALLRRIRRLEPPGDVCELCGARTAPDHQHLVDPAARSLVCVCDACAVLFDDTTRYRRVPRRATAAGDLVLTDEQWNGLLIPIGIAFFVRSSIAGRVLALYPSPGGPMESVLDLRSWTEIEAANPGLARMREDVEALLVNRVGDARDALLVPIDVCYELTGLVRANWRGLSGGPVVWGRVEAFFDGLRTRYARERANA